MVPGYEQSYAFGINGKGQVVGKSAAAGGGRATVWAIKVHIRRASLSRARKRAQQLQFLLTGPSAKGPAAQEGS